LIQEALVFLLEVWALLFIILLHLTLNWVFFLFALWFPIRMSASQSAEREIVLKKVLICCGGLWGAHHWAEKRFRAALLYLFTFGGATILVIRDLRSLPQLHPPPLPHTSSSPPPPPVNPTNRPPPKESHWLLQFIIPAGFIGFLTWGFHDLVPGPAGIGLVVSAGVGILAYLGLISVKTLFLHRKSGRLREILRGIPTSLYIYYRILPRTSERLDQSAMKRACEEPVSIADVSAIRIFHVASSPSPTQSIRQVHDTVAEFTREWADLPGLHYPQRNYRILVFEQQNHLQRYCRPYGKIRHGALGLFSLSPTPRVILQREWTRLLPGFFEHILAHECAHALHLSAIASPQTSLWQMEGISQTIARLTYPVPVKKGEIFTQARKAGLMVTGSEVLKQTDWLSGDRQESPLIRKALFYYQSALLTEWLVLQKPEESAHTLFTRSIQDPDLFQSHFGFTADDAMEQAFAHRQSLQAPTLTEEADLRPLTSKIRQMMSDPQSDMSNQIMALSFLLILPLQDARELLPEASSFRHKEVRTEAVKIHAFLQRLTDVE
jgi:hypothetical protein